MRFARRRSGVKAGRNVFRKAREDSRSRYQVYVAAAMMEYHCSKDTNIAFKIFELGLKVGLFLSHVYLKGLCLLFMY